MHELNLADGPLTAEPVKMPQLNPTLLNYSVELHTIHYLFLCIFNKENSPQRFRLCVQSADEKDQGQRLKLPQTKHVEWLEGIKIKKTSISASLLYENESVFKQCNAILPETLCLFPGKKVWQVLSTRCRIGAVKKPNLLIGSRCGRGEGLSLIYTVGPPPHHHQ